MKHPKTLPEIRRDYGQLTLNEEDLLDSPIAQFKCWFEHSLKTESDDPSAMVLSTVDDQSRPDSRVVLLKDVEDDTFIFYTNYLSAKGHQLLHNQYVALNFYWPHVVRQVRIRGVATYTSKSQSDDYFSSRPIGSQLSAILSLQSSPIESRAALEEKFNTMMKAYKTGETVPRPQNWGGYAVEPYEVEFWQGRDNRLHDRFQYSLENGKWGHRRLAP